jgi:hypothetical protein
VISNAAVIAVPPPPVTVDVAAVVTGNENEVELMVVIWWFALISLLGTPPTVPVTPAIVTKSSVDALCGDENVIVTTAEPLVV